VNQSFEIEMADGVGNIVATGFYEKFNYGSQPGLLHSDLVFESYKRARSNSNYFFFLSFLKYG